MCPGWNISRLKVRWTPTNDNSRFTLVWPILKKGAFHHNWFTQKYMTFSWPCPGVRAWAKARQNPDSPTCSTCFLYYFYRTVCSGPVQNHRDSFCLFVFCNAAQIMMGLEYACPSQANRVSLFCHSRLLGSGGFLPTELCLDMNPVSDIKFVIVVQRLRSPPPKADRPWRISFHQEVLKA